MRDGDTIRTGSTRTLEDDGWSGFTYAPGKGLVFVLLVLGVEPKKLKSKADMLDRFKALRDLGWVPESESLALATDDQLAAEVARRAAEPARESA